MSAMDHLRSEKGVAKKSSMTIIRLPRCERMIAGKKEEVGRIGFDYAGRLVALINFSLGPHEPAAQPKPQAIDEHSFIALN